MSAGGWSAGLLLATLAATAGYLAWDRAAGHAHARQAFEAFAAKYGRSYATRAERLRRFEVFSASLAYVEAENAKGHSYRLAINEFADQTPEELASTRLGHVASASPGAWGGLPHLGTHRYSGAVLPEEVDWTRKGAVTPPKNQGSCGSCWAFSSTGALEGAWEVATGELVSLSEQQLVDCSKGGNMGCKGGSMDLAFEYLEKHALCTESSYPYVEKDGVCRRETACTAGIPKGAIKGFHDVEQQSTEALMEAVVQQPVSVAIEADQMAFQLYSGGILSKECGAKLDHGVLLVGYGTEGGIEYWKVKNSWGTAWGEGGYIRLKRGVPKGGECGIKDGATYPVVEPVAAQLAADDAAAPAPSGLGAQVQVGPFHLNFEVAV